MYMMFENVWIQFLFNIVQFNYKITGKRIYDNFTLHLQDITVI